VKPGAAAAGLLAVVLVAVILAIGAVAGALLPAMVSALDCTGPVAATPGAWRPPLVGGYTVSSGYGMRYHPVLHTVKLHTGVDLVATGDQTVTAAADGVVTARGPHPAYGNQVVLGHRGGIQTRYAHLASFGSIQPGQRVRAGARLGLQGATGYATGPHLHFEVLKGGAPVDPEPFLADRGAPLRGRPVTTTPGADTLPADARHEGGTGFPLPAPGTPRQASLTNPALPIPADVKRLYTAAAARYKLPWALLAGIGMAETGHGRTNHTSTAGARGLMQFMPGTWASMGVDGDRDGRADILNDADSVFSAANYLTRSGVSEGEAGVRRALFAYNHADWYVNDVLHYAHAYGGGTVLGGVEDCHREAGTASRTVPVLAGDRARRVLAWASSHAGDAYVFGGTGPHAWDCSSFTQAAYRQAGISLPRTAAAQRDWLAAGNGARVPPGRERPGDLIFWDSYRGPNQIGHVAMVWDPTTNTTIEARSSSQGVGRFTYTAAGKQIFEIWRVGNLTPTR
jgi:hypothetical protein